jgi:hypothetical protein
MPKIKQNFKILWLVLVLFSTIWTTLPELLSDNIARARTLG